MIIDEIHALVPTKRGAHLALSLERLRSAAPSAPLQRIGLSATQRPLDEVARFLGGVDCRATAPRRSADAAQAADGADRGRRRSDGDPRRVQRRPRRRRATARSRSSTPSQKKQLELRIEVPVEDMARLGRADGHPERPGVAGAARAVDLDARSIRGCWSWCARTARR